MVRKKNSNDRGETSSPRKLNNVRVKDSYRYGIEAAANENLKKLQEYQTRRQNNEYISPDELATYRKAKTDYSNSTRRLNDMTRAVGGAVDVGQDKQRYDWLTMLDGDFNDAEQIMSGFDNAEDYGKAVKDAGYRDKYKGKSYSELQKDIIALQHKADTDKSLSDEIAWLKKYSSTDRGVIDAMTLDELDELKKKNVVRKSEMTDRQAYLTKLLIENRRKLERGHTAEGMSMAEIQAERRKLQNEEKNSDVLYYDDNGTAVTVDGLMAMKQRENELDAIRNDGYTSVAYEELMHRDNFDVDLGELSDFMWYTANGTGGVNAESILKETPEWKKYKALADANGLDLNKSVAEVTEDIERAKRYIEGYKERLEKAGYDWEKHKEYNKYVYDRNLYAAKHAEAEEYGRKHPLDATVTNIIASPFQAVDLVENLGENKTGLVNIYDDDIVNSISARQEGVTERIDESIDNDVMSWLATTAYSGVTSSLQSAATAAASNFLFGPAAGPVISLGILGSQAAASSFNEAIKNGSTNGQALGTAILAGVAEAAFEKLPLDNLFAAAKGLDTSSVKKLIWSGIKQTGKQSIIEGLEEAGTNIVNTIADAIINGDHSGYNTTVEKLVREGYTREEAQQTAAIEWLKEFAGDIVGGAFGGMASGGSVNLGGVVANYGNARSNGRFTKAMGAMNKANTTAFENLKSVAALMPDNTEVQKALKLVDKRDSNANVGTLARAVNTALSKEFSNAETIEELDGLKEKYGTNNSYVNEAYAREYERVTGNSYIKPTITSKGTRVEATAKPTQDSYSGTVGNLVYKGITKDGTDVEVKGIDVVSGEIVTDKGNFAAKDIAFADNATAALFENATKYNTPAVADLYVAAYNPNLKGVGIYNKAFEGIYEAALAGKDFDYAWNTFKGYEALDMAAAKAIWQAGYDEYTANQSRRDAKLTGDTTIAETPTKKAKSKGEVRFRNGVTADTAEQKNAVKLAKQLAKIIGIDIEFFDSRVDKNVNGWFDRKTDTIHLDMQKAVDDRHTIAFTLSHELVHFIEKWSPAKYDTLAKFLLEKYAEKGMDLNAMLIRKQLELEANNGGKRVSVDEAYSELIADACEAMLLDSNATEVLAELATQDKGLVEKIKRFFADILAKLRRAYKGLNPQSYEGQMMRKMASECEAIYRMFEDALAGAVENYQNAEVMEEGTVGENLTNEEAFADSEVAVQYQIRPPYNDGTTAFNEFADNLNPEARKTFDLFYGFYQRSRITNAMGVRGKKVKAINISAPYMLAEDWNNMLAAEPQWAEAARGLAEFLPDNVRKNMNMNEDGTLTPTPMEKEFKMPSSLAQRLVDALLPEKIDGEYQLGNKTITLPEGKARQSVGGEAYRRALIAETRKLYSEGKLRKVGIGTMSKDRWGSLGFLAFNGKTGASGDFTTVCPQMFFNRGCWYCYRRAAMEKGVNNKLVAQSVWYTGEILRIKDSDIENLNKNGGLRIQSFGDWMPHFSAMLADVLYDAEQRGLQVKIITKEPSMINYIAALREQGVGKNLYFNLSADYTIEKGPAKQGGDLDKVNPERTYMRDKSGEFWWKRAMAVEEAAKYREKYSWVNTRIVATDVEEFIRGLRDNTVDVVTGYHGNYREYARIDSATGEYKLNVEALGDAGMPRFAFNPTTGEWFTEYEGKTSTHKRLAEAIAENGLQYEYYIKTCCITGRCATCNGKCGALAKDFNIKNATNRDTESVAYWRQHMQYGIEPEFGDMTEDVQYQVKSTSPVPTFYSHMGKVIDGIKQEKVGAGGVVPYLKGKGVKNEEIKWSGIEAWLEGKKSVTKQELQEFVVGSMLQIEEEMSDAVDIDIFRDGDDYTVRNISTGEVIDKWEYSDDVEDGLEGWVNQNGEIALSSEELEEISFKEFSVTRWSQYKLHGGTNYRELVFKMPNSSYNNQMMRVHWGDDAEGVLAHARIQDFIHSFSGWKTLFVEEIQSDWHNEGAKEGYEKPLSKEEKKQIAEIEAESEKLNAERKRINGEWRIALDEAPDKADALEAKRLELNKQIRKLDDQLFEIYGRERNGEFDMPRPKGIPDAPFRSNYHEFVLKRLIRMAAEEDYDSIGWTTSKTQVERWSDKFAEGYRIEYDQDIPKFLSKYGKKWGAKVEKTELPNGTEAWSMDITNAMKQSVLYEGQAMFQRKFPSDRAILAEALESVSTTNEKDADIIRRYKAQMDTITKAETRLAEVNAEIKELSFAKGKRDTSRLALLHKEKTALTKKVNDFDKRLLRMESTEVLKNVLGREKAKVRAAANAKAKEKLNEVRQRERDRASAREADLKAKASDKLSAAKEKAEQREAAIREKFREAQEKGRNSRNKKKLIDKITNRIEKLSKLLNKPTKESHIKKGLRGTVGEAIALGRLIFSDYASNADIARYGVESVSAEEEAWLMEYRELLLEREALPYLDKTDPGYEENSTRRKQISARISQLNKKLESVFDRERRRLNAIEVGTVIDSLAKEYERLKDSDDSYIRAAYDSEQAQVLRDLSTDLGEVVKGDLTVPQLEAIARAYSVVAHTVATANKVFRNGRAESLEELVMKTQSDIERFYKEGKDLPVFVDNMRNFVDRYSWDEMKPAMAFERLGSDTFKGLYMDAVMADGVWGQEIDAGKKYIDRCRNQHGADKWDLEASKTYTVGGRSFRVSIGEMMSIYALSKRDQAGDHITVGGFVHGADSKYMSKKGVIKWKQKFTEKTKPFPVTWEELSDMLRTVKDGEIGLTQEMKDYVDEMQSYFKVVAEKGNEISNVLFGIDLFTEENYFPIQSVKDYISSLKTAFSGVDTHVSLKNTGVTKPTTPNANNPIVLRNFDTVWAEHIDTMAKYYAYVLPIENMQRVFNTTPSAFEDAETSATKALITRTFGSNATRYIETYLNDLNGGTKSYNHSFFNFFGKWKKARVAMSMSTAIQQPFAVVRAMDMIDMRYFGKQPKGARVPVASLYEELTKYAPIAITKEIGGYDIGSSRSAVDYIDHKFSTDDVTMYLPGKADRIGWSVIWQAVKNEVAQTSDLDVGSEAYYERCGERFTEVIAHTQVYDSVNSRSGFMRSKSDLDKFATSFMGEPTTIINMLYSSMLKVARADGGKARAKAIGRMARTYAVVLLSNALTKAAAALIYAGRDEDEDEGYWEKWAQAFGKNFVSDLNPFASLPYFRDIVSALEGWDIERPDMAVFVDAIKAYQKLAKAIANNEVTLDDAMGLIGNIGDGFGVPINNAWRDLKGLKNTIMTAFDGVGSDNFLGTLKEGATESLPLFEKMPVETKFVNLYDNGKTKEASSYLADVIAEETAKKAEKDGITGELTPYQKHKYEAAAKTKVRGDITSELKPLYLTALKDKDKAATKRIRKIMAATGLYDNIEDTFLEWRREEVSEDFKDRYMEAWVAKDHKTMEKIVKEMVNTGLWKKPYATIKTWITNYEKGA